MTSLPFVKMHGLGNDFVVIDQRQRDYQLEPAALRLLGDRKLGIGCDQILLIDPPRNTNSACLYRIFNGDGSAAEHCGNGIRCVARYLAETDGVDGELQVDVGDASFALYLLANGEVRVDMGVPDFSPASLPMTAKEIAPRYQFDDHGRALEFGAVSVGNPHAVLQIDNINEAETEVVGPLLQSAAMFPASVNVGFMQVLNRNAIALRVYERGVGETRACGTGACAAVAIGRRWNVLDNDVEVTLPGGKLKLSWTGQANDRLWMTGPATFVFKGTIDL